MPDETTIHRERRVPGPASEATGTWRFSLQGMVDGHKMEARYDAGHLVGDEPLLQQARIVVDLDDHFVLGNSRPLPAALDGPALAALLTMLRACDRVTSVDVDFLPPAGVA